MTVCLLGIDCQVDFCEGGALPVTGATRDLQRLAKMVEKNGTDIDDIQLTMDSHFYMHIAHPLFWQDATGNQPKPFTVITVGDVDKGIWRPKNKNWESWAKTYVETLRKNNRYELRIWNFHCIIGTPGQCLQPDFLRAVTKWELENFAMAPRTTKGSNPFTEHFSIVKADVSRADDPSTGLNGKFIDTLKKYDTILIGGEALSHCVCNSVKDIATEFSEDQIKKLVLLEDASSNVYQCEKLGQDFINEMMAKGMQLSRTDKFFN